MDSLARSIFVACLFVIGTHGIRFNMEGQTKCFRDEVQANQLIALEFELEDVNGQHIDYIVSKKLNNVWLHTMAHQNAASGC